MRMKFIKNSFIIFVILSFNVAFAQDGQGGVESNFIGFGAKALGMGNAYTAMANDPTAVYWNPAGLEQIPQQSVTLFHSTMFDGVSYNFLGYAYPTLDLGTFAIGIARIGVTGIDQTTPEPGTEPIGTFSKQDFEAYLSYAKKLPYDITAGISIRWISLGWSSLQAAYADQDGSAAGVGADLGILYQPSYIGSALLQDWTVGLHFRNAFAPQIREGDLIDEYPLISKLGIMRKIRFGSSGAFNLLFDLNHNPDRDLKFSLGSEYELPQIGKARVGFNTGGLAFGLGFEYDMFQLDYSYGSPEYSDVFPANHRISLTVNFGMDRDEMFAIAEEERKANEERIKKEIREQDKREFIATRLEQADQYFNEGRYLDAIVEYQQVIGADPFHRRAGIMLDSANVLLQRDFDTRQSRAVEDALDKERASSDSMFVQEHFEKGRLYLDKNQFIEALIEFNIALERDPDNQILRNSINTTQRRINEEVGSLVQKSREEFQKQNYSEALRLLADARLLGGDNPALQNEIETLAQRIRLQETIQQGLLLYDVGEYQQALDILGEALQLDPDNELVKQYYERSKLETSTDDDELSPELSKKYNNGMKLFLRGNYSEAIKIWREILEIEPYNKRVLRSISNAQERIKNTQRNP